jgi:hypothetical protein
MARDLRLCQYIQYDVNGWMWAIERQGHVGYVETGWTAEESDQRSTGPQDAWMEPEDSDRSRDRCHLPLVRVI